MLIRLELPLRSAPNRPLRVRPFRWRKGEKAHQMPTTMIDLLVGSRSVRFLLLAIVPAMTSAPSQVRADTSDQGHATLRVATYNTSLFRNRSGQLVDDLERGNQQARHIAEVLQRVRPDIVLLNEFDYDAEHRSAELFCRRYLAVAQNDQSPIEYAYRYTAPVNTGEPTGLDLDKDGKSTGPGDAFGWGHHPGQYGMLVLSKYPIAAAEVRTFQQFLWRHMPDHLMPIDPQTGDAYYTSEAQQSLRLSSKSFWDVPVVVGKGPGALLHLLCSHPTPPVFDGPEDRNGRRNHDEIRLLVDYIDGETGGYLADDAGRRGGLKRGERFVVLGDLNADPFDGGGYPNAIAQLLEHSAVDNSVVPQSDAGPYHARLKAKANQSHIGSARHDTANFSNEGHGNLRLDYVLPSRDLGVVDAGVFWPLPGKPGSQAAKASDHRLVWVDLQIGGLGEAEAEK